MPFIFQITMSLHTTAEHLIAKKEIEQLVEIQKKLIDKQQQVLQQFQTIDHSLFFNSFPSIFQHQSAFAQSLQMTGMLTSSL
jgi:SAM-dependent MidA family methyltransferase